MEIEKEQLGGVPTQCFARGASSETLIFEMQQHVIENTKHGHGLLLQMQKNTRTLHTYTTFVFSKTATDFAP